MSESARAPVERDAEAEEETGAEPERENERMTGSGTAPEGPLPSAGPDIGGGTGGRAV